MRFTVVVERLAQDHFRTLVKSGDNASLKKLNKILDELEIHPKMGTGKPEQLKYQL